ncbi:MAG: sigma-70 family RNA polymerase sigma factor [Anaerolineales bacterium]|nr:sigma-70 family RNA polymerase sigma factor [Anaerolineales bacterium]
MTDRTNEEWLADLQGPNRDWALDELSSILQKGLTYALARHLNVDDAAIQDFSQDALLRILENLDTFRGESRFLTWAQKIAVHTAFTELRRRRWQDVSLNGMIDVFEGDFVPQFLADSGAGPEQKATQQLLISTLRRLIHEELTEKQRQAMLAIVVKGMPIQEVARRMDTNRNALYKLLHDARMSLKNNLIKEGLSAQEVLDAFN